MRCESIAIALMARFSSIIMGIAMVAMLAFGGTFAYFTATATGTSGDITAGEVSLDSASITITSQTDTEYVVPNQSIISEPISVKNTSNVKTIMIAKLTVTPSGDSVNLTDLTVTANSAWEECDSHAGYYAYKGTGDYIHGDTADSEAQDIIDSIVLSHLVGNDAMNEVFTVSVDVYLLQADYLNSTANTATGTIADADAVYTLFETYYGAGTFA